jgi:hypothetical protein
MHWMKFVYYAFLTSALIASLRGYNQPRYVLFIPLLSLSLGVEILRQLDFIKNSTLEQTFSFFIAIEYTFLCLIISLSVQSIIRKNIIRFSVLFVVPLLVLIKIKLVSYSDAYKYLDLLVAAPFICIWTILYLFENATNNEIVKIQRSPMFWISIGNLLFFSGSFFSYGFGSYMVAKGKENIGDAILWIARILNIFLYFFYFVGLLCLPKKK